jgi:surfactin synthase thioesterase subunit
MPPWIEVVGCHLPGHEERMNEQLLQRMDRLQDAMVCELAPLLDLPFAFFGHSLGGHVAFHAVRHLRRIGLKLPQSLIVSASQAPHLPLRFTPIQGLAEEEFLQEIQLRYERIPDEILKDRPTMELVLRILRADFSLLETTGFEPEPPLPCPILACGGKNDSVVSEAGMKAWSVHTAAKFRLEIISGGHFYVRSPASELLPRLVRELEIAVATHSG